MVTIRVGVETAPFHVHYKMITHHSPYFRSAFDGSFKEAHNKSIKLDDVDPWMFKIFMGWLYTQEIACDKSDISIPEGTLRPNQPSILCLKRVSDPEHRDSISQRSKQPDSVVG